jgi:NAD(P)H-dependent flavin oxidoreductase YrpB (nitropropane dioxygenase family)
VGLQRLNAIASFVEVFLAKEDHDGIVGINFLEKLQTSNLPGIYGAMLAGVDYVLMGAGVPREIPGVLDSFSRNEKALIKVSLTEDHQEQASDLHIGFDPKTVFSNLNASSSLRRPRFLPIISSATLALHLSRKSNGKVDGFVVENHLAGGHNAPPRGVLQLNERSEPIYGERDDADLEAIRKIGLPFWLAGSFGSPQSLEQALHWGATGIQVGTPFAFCNESGLSQKLKHAVIRKWCFENDLPEKATVFTDPLASPTGFPFKVVPIEKSLSDGSLFQARPRKCDLGYLRQIVRTADGKVVYRCPAEPIDEFLKKGGKKEETINRKCLCNALMANINIGQTQEDGYEELPLVTAGNDLTQLRQFLSGGREYYGAKDVISRLLHATESAEQI